MLMSHYIRWSLLILTCLTVLSGCAWLEDRYEDTKEFVFDSKPTATPGFEEDNTPIIELNYDAAASLAFNVKPIELPDGSPVYIRKFVNKEDPTDTSRFGLIVATQVANRLAQRGLLMTEGVPPAEAYQAPPPREKGNFLQLPDKRSAKLDGSYIIGQNVIYVTGKIVRLDDNAIVSAHNWTLPINDNTRSLLPQLQAREKGKGIEPSVKTTF